MKSAGNILNHYSFHEKSGMSFGSAALSFGIFWYNQVAVWWKDDIAVEDFGLTFSFFRVFIMFWLNENASKGKKTPSKKYFVYMRSNTVATILSSIFRPIFETSLNFVLCFFNLLLYPFNSFYITLENKADRNFETIPNTAVYQLLDHLLMY